MWLTRLQNAVPGNGAANCDAIKNANTLAGIKGVVKTPSEALRRARRKTRWRERCAGLVW